MADKKFLYKANSIVNMPLRPRGAESLMGFALGYVTARKRQEPAYEPPEPVRRFLEQPDKRATEQEAREAYNALMQGLDLPVLGRVLLYGIVFYEH